VTRPGEDRIARAALTVLADPADPMLGSLLQVLPPGEVLAMISSGIIPARAADALDPGAAAGLRPALARLRARLARLNATDMLARHAAAGIRLICPGDPDWPTRLDDLGAGRPYGLWARGTTDLQACLARPAAVVGARAATAYGIHVGGQIAAGLSHAGWTIVSGAAYGIDAAAHRAALAADGLTVAVLACGPDVAYPAAHRGLLETIAASGAIVSCCGTGSSPSSPPAPSSSRPARAAAP
jgi:DNA processing protein